MLKLSSCPADSPALNSGDAQALHLRDFTSRDLLQLTQAFADARVRAFYGLATTRTDGAFIAREQLDWYAELAADGEGWWQALCVSQPGGPGAVNQAAKDAVVIGGIGVYARDDDGDSAELGFWLAHAAWGQGWMKRALPLFLPQAFARLKLHSVQAYVAPENARSLHRLQAAGFVHEGVQRECARRADGRYVSLHRLSLLVHELPLAG